MRHLDHLTLIALYGLLLWAPVASGAYWGWPLAITQLLTLVALVLWTLRMVAERRLEWRRTALDLPLALLLALVLVQLALGNRPLAEWALAPPTANPTEPVAVPTPVFTLGTVSPAQTTRSLLLLLTYAGVYALVVNLIRTRSQLDRLVRTLLVLGGILAFFGLLDYLVGEAWLTRWRHDPFTGRLSGTFVNPDHFATWLAMLVCLGLGYLLARRRLSRADRSLFDLLGSHDAREQVVRRYLPFVGVGVMALAVVFTLSRGGVLSLLLTLAVLLLLLGAVGWTRWSLVLVGGLLVVTLGYGTWIGLEPFLERVWHGDYASRWIQSLTTLPMLRAFPFLGVGLGAYRDIYSSYQPPALDPGKVYYPHAHNDLLQLVVELGLLGGVLVLFAIWRVGRDLLAVHLLGKGPCPVGGGEDEGAQRSDPFSVGIALGALGSVLVLLFHSGVDFAARIPANGILAAACLGIATVALHTRFSMGGERLLTAVRARSLGSGRFVLVIAGATALALSLPLLTIVVRQAVVEAKLHKAKSESRDGPAALARLAEALAVDPYDVRALLARAHLRHRAARRVWNSGVTNDERILTSWEDRRPEALHLLDGATQDLRTALSVRPSDPFLHERLGWVHGTAGAIDSSRRSEHRASAFTHLQRAIALGPENPFLYRSLAALAISQRPPLLEVGLPAARAAVQRDPELLLDLVDRFLPLALSEADWLKLVPDSVPDRLELAALLEGRGLLAEAAQAYRGAIELASSAEQPFSRWMLARLLLRNGDYGGATKELDEALRHDADNPELHLVRAQALAAGGDPAALDAHRAAVLGADARARRARDPLPFEITEPRARALASEALGQGKPLRPVRYRHALAQYLTDRKLWHQALREWDAVLAETPRDPSAHFSRGVALEGIAATDQALEAYRRAVSLDGRAVDFRLQLAQTLWETDQYYQAMNEWRIITSQEPGNVEARLALAGAYLRIGERIQAFREYQRILLMVPDHAEARRALARLRGANRR